MIILNYDLLALSPQADAEPSYQFLCDCDQFHETQIPMHSLNLFNQFL
jgi:hypothetical protein